MVSLPSTGPSLRYDPSLGNSPSDAAILERTFSMVSESAHTVALQARRLESKEPEDESFIFRWWADLQFFILALRRVRRAALLGLRVSAVAPDIKRAVRDFDRALPGLAVMRNVGEHAESYAVDDPKRHHTEVDRRQLQVGSWDGATYTWLVDSAGHSLCLNVEEAKAAVDQLFLAVKTIVRGDFGDLACPSGHFAGERERRSTRAMS